MIVAENIIGILMMTFACLVICQSKETNGLSERVWESLEEPRHINDSCVCGKEVTSKVRIVGGSIVSPGNKHSYMARILQNGETICSGTLISQRFILTAAQCVDGKNPENITVVLASQDTTNDNDNVTTQLEELRVEKIRLHGSYSTTRKIAIFNLALLKLEKEIFFNDELNPICLPKFGDIFLTDKLKGKTLGWTESEPWHVKELDTTAISTHVCQKKMYGKLIVKEMLCVKDAAGKSGFSNIDIGAPFLSVKNNLNVQHGIAFYNKNKKLAGVYTLVRSVVTWIYYKSRGSYYCTNPVAGY